MGNLRTKRQAGHVNKPLKHRWRTPVTKHVDTILDEDGWEAINKNTLADLYSTTADSLALLAQTAGDLREQQRLADEAKQKLRNAFTLAHGNPLPRIDIHSSMMFDKSVEINGIDVGGIVSSAEPITQTIDSNGQHIVRIPFICGQYTADREEE